MITTVLVEDDLLFRESIIDILSDLGGKIQLLEVCTTLRQAHDAILKHNPQLLLLDVELPDGKSTDLLNKLDEENVGTFEVIFITAHNQYAIEAIKRDAADYILKPVKQNELLDAIAKVENRLSMYRQLLRTEELEKQISSFLFHQNKDNKLVINTLDGVLYLRTEEIIRLEAESNYTTIFLESQKKITASKTLYVFEEMLQNMPFFRVHRQAIINLTKIKNIQNHLGASSVVLSDGSIIEISRRKKKDFFEKIATDV